MSKELAKRSPTESPYKLDSSQTLTASGALLKCIANERKEREARATKKNLLTAGDGSDEDGGAEEAEPVQLVITTKKQMATERTLKARKIALPHTLNVDSAVSSICLITPDPQRRFKDVVDDQAFPRALAGKLRVLGVDKLKSRYKSFEQRRQLRDEHDVFLADERIVPMLPSALGKIFFESGAKRPLPVSLAVRSKDADGKTVKVTDKKINSNKRNRDEGSGQKEVSVLSPEAFAREIERTLSCAQIHLAPSVTTTIRVGFSTFTAKQLAENIEAVVQGMTEKYIGKGWRSVRSIHIKGPKTIALPVWQTPELWEEEQDVIEDGDAERLKELDEPSKKRRAIEGPSTVGEKGDKKSKKQKLLSQNAAEASNLATERRDRVKARKAGAERAIAAGA